MKKEENMDFVSNENIFAMASDPLPDKTPDQIKKMYEENNSIENLVDLYAMANNKFWWIEDDLYDYDVNSNEYKDLRKIVDSWWNLVKMFENEIFKILEKEGIETPKTGTIEVLRPFMKKYHYLDGNGWWIKEK